jgi:hypothetical protein
MRNTTHQTRENRTITVDFHNEATYYQLLGDGKAFVEGCVFIETTPPTLVFQSSIQPCLVSPFFLQKQVSGGHEPWASRRIWPGDCVDSPGFRGTPSTHRNRH